MDPDARRSAPDPDGPPAEAIRFELNGRREVVRGEPVHRTALEYLRSSGRSGTKEGCGEGDCGACTVAVRSDHGGTPRWQAVNACLLPLAALHGRQCVTVEGLREGGALHPVQRALVDRGGSQCGYCTPGFVMSLFAAHTEGDLEGEATDRAVEGNLCRCTGYLPIRRAAHDLAPPAPSDPWQARLAEPAEASAPFTYAAGEGWFARPTTLAEALDLLAAPGAVPLAGATDLGVEVGKLGRRYPKLVSLEALPELQVLEDDDGPTLGAAVPLAGVEAYLEGLAPDAGPARAVPALREMLRWFAARQIKNRATIGGNLATASPIGDLAPALLALDARVLTAHPEGGRDLPLDGFFTGYRRTGLRPGELIRAVHVPKTPPPEGGARLQDALKVGKRGTDDIAIVAGAFDVHVDADGTVARARLGYGGVAATPARAHDVERWLEGRPWAHATVDGAAARLREAFTPLDDHRGSAAYRRALCGSLFTRFAFEAGVGSVPDGAAA